MEEKREDFTVKVRKGKIDDEALVGQLFTALSSWWYSAQTPIVGVSRQMLTDIIPAAKLDDLLRKLEDKIEPLNLELVEYKYNRQRYYCLRSRIVAPSLLTEKEQAVLGFLIHLIYYPKLIAKRKAQQGLYDDENSPQTVSEQVLKKEAESLMKDRGNKQAPNVALDTLRRQLVDRYIGSKTELDRLLNKLASLGYIINEKKKIYFGPRTLFEFPLEALEEIAESVAQLIK